MARKRNESQIPDPQHVVTQKPQAETKDSEHSTHVSDTGGAPIDTLNYEGFREKINSGSIETGYYEGIPNLLYHSTEGLSSTGLREFMISPAHFKHRPVRKPKVNEGAMVHLAVLEPDLWAKTVVLVPDARPKAGRDAKAEALAQGKIVVNQSTYDLSLAMAQSIRSNPLAMKYLSGKNEISGFTYCPHFEYLMKIRPDSLSHELGAITDLKTIGRGMRGFDLEKLAFNRGWHLQAAFYVYVNKLITGKDYKFVHVYIEKEAPYAIQVKYMDPSLIERSTVDIMPYLEKFHNCLVSNNWTEVSEEATPLTLPSWALSLEPVGRLGRR